jgi:small nuclear ribonucleoprotein (snRNP)-like protein
VVSAVAAKRFTEEFATLLDKPVTVTLKSGQKIAGRVVAFNQSDYSLWLTDAVIGEGRSAKRVFVSGSEISTIEVAEEGPDLMGLYERLNRVFPNMVRYLREAGVIVVMERVRVTKDGLVEGTGPVAERVRRIWEEWRAEARTTG